MKLVKPQNDTYIDSSGIMHNKKKLSEVLNIATATTNGLMSSNDKEFLDNSVKIKKVKLFPNFSDNSTISYTILNNYTYIFINQHPIHFGGIIFNVSKETKKITQANLFGNSQVDITQDNANNYLELTFKANNQCDGYLYITNTGFYIG